MIKMNTGGTRLIPRDEWVLPTEIQGEEIKTLTHPIIERVFHEILQQFRPSHDVCLVSLCTATRPYSKSAKWSKFIELFGDSADMIVCSNGEIIPLEFEGEYPYLTYDAHGNSKYDRIYIRTVYRRLMTFFEKHHYKKIVFNFRPNLRNRKSAILFKQEYGKLFPDVQIFIRPTEDAYTNREKTFFIQMNPDLDVNVLKEIEDCIRGDSVVS